MEVQPIIMAAGQGSRMTELTAKTAKALLPVANMPMIWYPVQLLEKAGFQDALVVVLESEKASIKKALEDICAVKIRLDFVAIPEGQDLGTAHSLRLIKDKIKGDLLVLSCDLVTDISLHLLADVHRTNDATVTMLMAPVPDITEIAVPGGKANRKIEKDFVGLDDRGNRVLFLSSEGDFEEFATFKKSFLKRHPVVSIHTSLNDCHLYMMKYSVLEFLLQEEHLNTVKGELIPYLVQKQFSKKKRPAQNHDVSTISAPNNDKTDISDFVEEDRYTTLAREYSSWNDHQGDMEDCYHGDKVRCHTFVLDGGFCLRTNTLATYCEANRQVPRQLCMLSQDSTTPLVHPTATIAMKSTVGADSMVGEGTTVAEKVTVKRSVIGKHCTIGEKVKIANCVIMDHAVVKEGSSLSGCVVCENAEVDEKCELRDCIVGNSQHVMSMVKYTNEVLVERDRMMEY